MEDYASKIASIKGQIQQYKDEFAVLTDRIVGNDLEKDDFYFLAALDRAIHLIDGFLWMLEKRNITCAGALLRLQIDNCLRVCAPYIAKNREDVINTIIYEDKRLNRLPDDQGERMSDGRLKDRLAEKYPEVKSVYEKCSGFIHLSDIAFYQTVNKMDQDGISLSVGGELPARYNDTLISLAQAYLHFCKIFVELLLPVAEAKENLEKMLDERDFNYKSEGQGIKP